MNGSVLAMVIVPCTSQVTASEEGITVAAVLVELTATEYVPTEAATS